MDSTCSVQIQKLELTLEQRRAYELMRAGKNVFVTGAGGCGKTLLINRFIVEYKTDINVAVTSTTGTSALLLMGGTTLHSWGGIGLGTGSALAMATKIKKKPWLRKRWKEVNVLIIDEVSMLDPTLFDKLEYIARVIRKSAQPFGGIQLVVTGDFLQLPCVKSDKFCFEADTWDSCIVNTVYLQENMRQREPEWQKCLAEIRIGKLSDTSKELLESRRKVKLENTQGILPTRLYPLNRDVDEINASELDRLSDSGSEFFEYQMTFDLYDKKLAWKAEKFYKDSPAVEKLLLCIGCQVILLWNLDIECGLVNGSRGVIVDFLQDLPLVRFLNGTTRLIDYHIWELEEDDKKLACFEQIPLRLGYAYSVHRAQGRSLDYVITDLKEVFEYGQAYVALSRARSSSGLSIKGLRYKKIRAHPKAVDYYEKLLSKE